MSTDPLIPEHVQVSVDNRVTLPKRFSEALPWIKGTELQAWLFLVELGRYRLLSEEDVQNDPLLEPVRGLIMQEKTIVATGASYAENSADVAMTARLIPITVRFHRGSWRIPFPEEWSALAPVDSNPRAISFLISPKGFLEIWYTDLLRRVLTPSWRQH